MRQIIACLVVMVLLVSTVPMAATPAAAYEKEIPFAGEDNELTKDELASAICSYMLDGGTLDDIGDASWVYAYWNVDGVGKPKTVVDSAVKEVTIYRPIERIVVTFRQALEMVRLI